MRGEMPLIVAHRGASAAAPENTLAAFRRAIACGAEGIEFDVRLAADGMPVVIHDPTLKRTCGRPERVSDVSSKELSRVDAGSWLNRKHPERADPEFENQSVPTLRETLDLLSRFDGRIFIELKSEEPDILPLCRSVAGIIADSTLKPQLVVKSFRLAAIPAMRALCPGVTTAALFEPKIKTILRKKRSLITVAREIGANELSIYHSLATRRLTAAAQDAGLPIVIWTVDDPRWIRKAPELGVYALITNDPERMMREREAFRIKT
jgi:glycerophosphoryl diester phosphodiesterase